MRRIAIPLGFVVALTAIVSNISLATTYEVKIPDLIVIQNENGVFRVLLNPISPEGFQSFDIELARLIIPFGPVGQEVDFQLFPISTYWVPNNVNWDYPWVAPGGDYDDSLSLSTYSLKGGNLEDENAVFPVTEALILLQQGVSYYGFILMPPPYEKAGFDSYLMPSFEGLNGTILEIKTR